MKKVYVKLQCAKSSCIASNCIKLNVSAKLLSKRFLCSMLTLAYLLISTLAHSQSPQAIPYQAVARDASGNILPNTQITFLFLILDQPNAWIPEYQETHTVTTNSLGLFNVNIGEGTPISGTLNGINWASGEHYLRTLMSVNSAVVSPYAQDMGTVRFNSVPYALYASHCSDNQWLISGTNLSNTNSGNIGIGTSAPNTKLDVRGNISQGTWLDDIPNRRIGVMDGATHTAGMEIENTSLTGNYSQKLHLLTHHYATSYGRRFTIDEDGQVGIGTEFPNALLHVNGTARFGNYLKIGTDIDEGYFQNSQDGAYRALQTGGDQGYFFQNYNGVNTSMYVGLNGLYQGKVGIGTAAPLATLHLNNPGQATTMLIGENPQGGGSTNLLLSTSAYSGGYSKIQSISSAGSTWGDVVINSDGGNVGIGTSTPQAKLEVDGNVIIADGTQGTGKVLTSDANGLAAWATPLTGAQGPAGADGDRFTTTSTTPLSIATGTQNLTVGTGLQYSIGQTVLVANSITNLMTGTVISYDGANGNLTLNVTSSSGSGTFSNWNVSLNGAPGPQGAPGIINPGSAVGNTTYWDGTDWVTNSNNLFNDGDKIGIGTSTPTSKVEVYNGDVVFVGTNLGNADPIVSGSGLRMGWYQHKGAFRVGQVNGTQWDWNNIGYNSFASGYNTKASNFYAIAMGSECNATSNNAIAMGNSSTAAGNYAIALGANNTASNTSSLALGHFSLSSGLSSISIGFNTTASGDHSTALGNYISTNGQIGTFAIGDYSTSTVFNPLSTNKFYGRFANGYTLYTNPTTTSGVFLTAGAGSWSGLSDRTKKENFVAINQEEILTKLASISVSQWNYKSQDKNVHHIGCMAQDFYQAFHLDGESDTTINTLDIDGINMAAIQALKNRTDELKKATDKIESLEKSMAVLEEKMNAIIKSVNAQK